MSLEKVRIGNDVVLTHKILYNQNDMEATQLFKLFRRPGLIRLSLRLSQQAGGTLRRRSSVTYRAFMYCNRLLLAVASVSG